MIGSIRASRNWLALTCVAALALAGCGNNGDASANIPQQPPPVVASVKGHVFTPNPDGLLSAAGGWWQWPDQLHLAPAAFAGTTVGTGLLVPVIPGLPVSLALVNEGDASNGQIDTPELKASALTQDDDQGDCVLQPTNNDACGRYEIINSIASDVDTCRLMVAIGSGGQAGTLTRAFVFSHNINVDAVSEATVRVVLDRIAHSQAQLCQFTSNALEVIHSKVFDAAYTATGSTVAAVNQSAFEKAVTNKSVQKALDDVTGPLTAQ